MWGSKENPALVLNADFRPLNYFPLSLLCWQDAVKAVVTNRVNVISEYDQLVHSPSFKLRLPSVISLKEYVPQARKPAFTRFNVFLRDRFDCQYCGHRHYPEELTFDHVIPRRCGGQTTWENVVAACSPCNLKKGGLMPEHAGSRFDWKREIQWSCDSKIHGAQTYLGKDLIFISFFGIC